MKKIALILCLALAGVASGCKSNMDNPPSGEAAHCKGLCPCKDPSAGCVCGSDKTVCACKNCPYKTDPV